jgi:prepilin-type N-terminal cleavage/methylation domain-containing protein
MPHRAAQAGFTLIELLVSLLLVAIVLVAASSSFFETTRRSLDDQTILRTQEAARTALDFMAYDLRMAGSGMPLGQASFTIADAALGDAPLAILTTAASDSIQVRINETGKTTVLMSDYTPSSTDLSFAVHDAGDLSVGDAIYISDMPRGGAEGFRGIIDAIMGDTITVDDAYVVSPGASFSAGALVARVTTVSYTSPVDGSGITRDPESGPQLIAPRSTFTLRYFDGTGTELAPPLAAATIADALASVLLTVTVNADRPSRDGSIYAATVEQRIAFRNMNMNR